MKLSILFLLLCVASFSQLVYFNGVTYQKSLFTKKDGTVVTSFVPVQVPDHQDEEPSKQEDTTEDEAQTEKVPVTRVMEVTKKQDPSPSILDAVFSTKMKEIPHITIDENDSSIFPTIPAIARHANLRRPVSQPTLIAPKDIPQKLPNTDQNNNIGHQRNKIEGRDNRIEGHLNTVRGDTNHITQGSYGNYVQGNGNIISNW